MKTFTSVLAGLAMTLLIVGSVHAQTVSIGSGSGATGGDVTVQLNWDNSGNAYRSLQFDVMFDNLKLSAVETGSCLIEPYITGYLITTCAQRAAPNENQVRLGLTLISGAIPSGPLGQLTFTIADDASPGDVDLTIGDVVIEGDPTPAVYNGTITIR
jgi:hypothetical protein